MGIIIPKRSVDIGDAPIIFLLGPIRSAPAWQDRACSIILAASPEIIIANPRREVARDLEAYLLPGTAESFPRQRAWEWHHQRRAAENGALMFWLPGEEQHHCEKSYGLMTSNEFGHWTARYEFDPSIPLVVGTDGKFNEWKTFAYDLAEKAPHLVVRESLEETCHEAVRLAYRR